MPYAKQLVVIGGGNMAEALLRGILAANRLRPADILATDVRPERLAVLETTYHIGVAADNAVAARQAETILLAVKPQVMSRVLSVAMSGWDKH